MASVVSSDVSEDDSPPEVFAEDVMLPREVLYKGVHFYLLLSPLNVSSKVIHEIVGN